MKLFFSFIFLLCVCVVIAAVPVDRKKRIVHWDGKNNNNEYVESGVYIWIIEEEDGSKYDGKVVVIR